MIEPYTYHQPTSLAEAWRLRSELAEAAYLAGGTDLMVRIRSGRQRPKAVISLRHIAGLDGVNAAEDGVVVGALTRVGDLVAHPALVGASRVLSAAAARLGSVQIRNAATLGGNLCNASPCADLAPPLLVLDARLRIEGPAGRREVALRDFVIGPGEVRLTAPELLTAVVIPRPALAARATFSKKSRVRMDLSIANVALLLELAEDGFTCVRARAAAGSVAPRPWRLTQAEAELEGHDIRDERVRRRAAEAARAEIAPIDDLRASAHYRRRVVGALLQRAIGDLLQGTQATHEARP